MSIRSAIAEEINLLAHPNKQLQYEKDVLGVNIPAELICRFCDDLYHPKSEQLLSEFSVEELYGLAHLYGVLCEASNISAVSVTELHKHPKWGRVVEVAKELNAHYARNT